METKRTNDEKTRKGSQGKSGLDNTATLHDWAN